MRGLHANELNRLLTMLVKQFVQIQDEGKPVERIVGNDIDKFCDIQIRRHFPFKLVSVFFQNVVVIGLVIFLVTTVGAVYNQFTGQILNVWKGWWSGGSVYLAVILSSIIGLGYYLGARRLLFLVDEKLHERLKKMYLFLPLFVLLIVIVIGNFITISFTVSLYRIFYLVFPICVAGISGFFAYNFSEKNNRRYRRQKNLIQTEFKKVTKDKKISFGEYIYNCKCETKQNQTISRACLLLFAILQVICLWQYYFESFLDIFFMGAVSILFVGIAYFFVELSKYSPKMQLLEDSATIVDK
jgi:hypothetical protein